MRQGPSGRRPRGRPNRKQHGGHSRPSSYDSGGSEGRIRGNANQVYEKYVALARDAVQVGDRVAAETYFQYAEHYYRIVNSSTDPVTAERPQQRRENDGRENDGRENDERDADTRDANGADRQDRHGQAPREQDRGQDERRNEARAAPGDGPQPAPAPARRPEEDRAGLDRVLGKDGEDTPQAGSDSPPDREAGASPKRRRSRQRPAAESGNGEAKASAAKETASGQPETAKKSAPEENDRDSEPAGT